MIQWSRSPRMSMAICGSVRVHCIDQATAYVVMMERGLTTLPPQMAYQIIRFSRRLKIAKGVFGSARLRGYATMTARNLYALKA